MPWVASTVLDGGLSHLLTGDDLMLCTAEPTSLAIANANAIGSVVPTFQGPRDGLAGSREIEINPTSDNVTGVGVGLWVALASPTELLWYDSVESPSTYSLGNVWVFSGVIIRSPQIVGG